MRTVHFCFADIRKYQSLTEQHLAGRLRNSVWGSALKEKPFVRSESGVRMGLRNTSVGSIMFSAELPASLSALVPQHQRRAVFADTSIAL